jgi:DnaD/phage-associated family protein
MEKLPEKCIPQRDLNALIAAHDGDVALLYLYFLSRGGDPEGAARELCRTGSDIAAAEEKLRRLGILPGSAAAERAETRPAPADELPEYTAAEIARRSEEDGSFKAVVTETQRVLGRTLSGADLKALFGIYDYLALPPEVILELLDFCVERCRDRYGPGRLPSMRVVEKEAYVWANRELLTMEQAEEYIEEYKKRGQSVSKAKAVLGIRGRDLTSTEQRYVEEWLDMGFGAEMLEAAYDRTVTNTGSMKWPYMNKILTSWHEKGLHTPEDIAEKDGAPRRAAPPTTAKKSNAERISALKNKIRPSESEG